jgi:hypothetical protein
MVNQWIKHLGRTRKQHPELKNDFKGLAAKAKETYNPQKGGSCEDPTNCSEGMQGGRRNRKKSAGTRHGKKRGGKKSRKAGMHMRGGDDHEDVPAPPGPPAPPGDLQDGGDSPLETGNADDAPAPAPASGGGEPMNDDAPDAAEAVNDDAPDAAPDAQEGGRRRRRRKSSSKRRSHKKSHGRKKSARKSKRKSKRRSRR